ncbi:UDP-N-acetylmuramoyl-L-alanyl-D-glutamate--2,6-diaminopimelate ligase [Bifidobacterium sp. W8108]|uniref:UDP-N-acetylmuramoyl-L-alanyl-D-glutamate--2, 6-diaminopimelate ligase n=1 Tax=unclassified Bifidobacterium TaxID=2608897 RepID=UPI0018DBBBCA|nr:MULTISPECIES: UDP-N-acetylmuramoyl-L-alanyl-D-glutamate--2,6-diaminopimelate ligase [unclassified Bifidobacterium]MBH9979034.1 UDP-N-acetylmuramoyl-L-alanyl-D-glutamate--2,6-diaminopimelate ligase [Bifidobacterium sp. W8108]MBI0173095.1 UDP-N-acetylmuramoyl-L-alanyl-D-glutamate--2,6-diaminopimelate ligase [Bifidobacterium sp. M0307]
MALTMTSALDLLGRHHLLREVIQGGDWSLDAPNQDGEPTEFKTLTYDTRQVEQGSLLFCKGNFKPEYLDGCDQAGMAAYVAETDLSERCQAPGIIVSDVRKAMSLLAAAHYGYPQDDLTLVGITGTKGKTTTAYFLQSMLNQLSDGRAALLSSVDNCLDGQHYRESELTTPESLDLFRMMRQAVDAGMRYMVMEVSSQAYKVDRVYGLTFDLGAFLNVSPDHISPIEHPTFEDYLFCKRQLTYNSRKLVLGADCAHADLIRQDAAAAGTPLTTFGMDRTEAGSRPRQDADFLVRLGERHEDGPADSYLIGPASGPMTAINPSMDGDFNALNACAALAMVQALGLEPDQEALKAMEEVRIAGRMEHFASGNRVAYVDYAHNQASVKALLDFVDEQFGNRNPAVTLVSGSAGDKAIDRRQGIVQAAQNRVDRLIITGDDEGTEGADRICRQMLGYVTNPDLDVSIILDRTQAITTAIQEGAGDGTGLQVILIIGKGEERWIKVGHQQVPYEGDDRIVARLLGTRSHDLGATGTPRG